jgi:hypothetical protein
VTAAQAAAETNLDGRKDAEELSRSLKTCGASAPIDQDFANSAANLNRTGDAVNAACWRISHGGSLNSDF